MGTSTNAESRVHSGSLLPWLAILAAAAACTPGTPRIDGGPGAPQSPATPWSVPAPARTPPPPPNPVAAPAATNAFRTDSAPAASATHLSLTDVIDLALRNNPATRESWALARSAAESYGSARGSLFPNINANVGLGRSSSSLSSNGLGTTTLPTDTTGGSTRALGGSSITRTQLTPSATLSYLVFDLGGRAGTIESAKQRAIAADLTHNVTIQNVVLQAESTLFSFLATRGLRDAQIVAVQEAQADTAASEARMRVGVGTLEEVLQSRTALAQARFQLATLEGNLLSARGSLAAAIGLPANARFDVPAIVANDSVATIAASVDTLINRAIVLRPDIAESRAEAAALAADVRVARAAGFPALTLSSNASLPRTIQGSTNSSSSYSLQLGVQIPIFNGFSRQYDLKAARDQYEAGLARVASTTQQVTVQVFASYAALSTSTQRVAASVDLLASATQSAAVALGRYREGVGTIVDVLLAQTALATARAEAIQARWEWQTALAQLAHDTGSLDVTGRPNVPLGPP
jgi:outer membrane protein